MACAHPLYINPSYLVDGHFYTYDTTGKGLQVPCGYCVNCRRDYQNYLADRAEYEYCKRLTASFVTFTYDDIHLIDRCAVRDPSGGFMYDEIDGERTVRTSLNFKDVQNYIDSIRKYVQRFYEKKQIPVNVLMQPDFSYMYVGEYGDKFGRCHFHVLFFGLDYAFCSKILFERWKYGLVDVLPLLDGGIRYVTKYMDKMDKGYLAWKKYDCLGISRPKLKMSVGFGQGLLYDNIDDIYENAFTYKAGHVRRPISAYWKKLITGNKVSRNPYKIAWNKLDPQYEVYKRYVIAEKMKQVNLHHCVDVSLPSAQEDFKLRCALTREENLKIQLRNSGVPVYDDIKDIIKSRFGFVTYDNKVIRALPRATQRLLVDEYKSTLFNRWLNKKFPEKVVKDV